MKIIRTNKNATVVGAGPAGLTASIILKKAGYDVDLYEQNDNVGLRFNGDFQGLENWSDEEDTLDIFKNIGLEINFLCQPYSGDDGIFFGPNRKSVKVKTSRPLFYLIERGSNENSLDRGLLKQAEAVGVNIHWGEKLDIVKDSPTIIGSGPKAADAIAKGMVFKTTHKDFFIGFLDNKIAPKAYAYLLVNNGKATFATCMFDDFKNEKLYYRRALARLDSVVNIDKIEPKEFGGFVNFFSEPKYSKDNGVLYVGENAGFQDALWGFGIKYAMLSGYYAAQSIIAEEDYKELCKKNLVPKLQTSLANRLLFANFTNFGYSFILSRLGKLPDVIVPLRKHYNPSTAKRIFYKIAKRTYKSRLIDKQCMHIDCDCVWCRHGKSEHREVAANC
ncbi:MAG: NAD(P)/FAD-dependent oxidoreductase [Chlorobi bacterium]|nr:NAD(P)/FAD-dependent oxidoreductase [Chlorobiota bacterium]